MCRPAFTVASARTLARPWQANLPGPWACFCWDTGFFTAACGCWSCKVVDLMEWRVYWKAFKVSLQTQLEYRADFALRVVAALLSQAAGLSFLWVVFHQSPSIMGWEGGQVLFLFGMISMAQGLSEIFSNHIWWVPAYLISGELDRLLL